MATVPEVTVRGMWDGDSIKSGTEESARAMEDLAREVDYAADDINASLRSMDDGVSSTLSAGGTLDDGTTSASANLKDLASNAKEEIPGAMLDMQDGVTSAASGIAAALAPMGAGGLVLSGVLAGFTILKNRADEAAQEMRDKINSAVQSIEVKANQTNAALQRMYEKQLTFQSTLEEFGEGDATKGYEKLAGYAEDLGLQTEDLVAFVQGRQTPATERVAAILAKQGQELKGQGEQLRENYGAIGDNVVAASELLKAAEREREARERANDQLRDNRDYLREVANDSQRAADAWERIASAQLNIVRQQSNLSGAGAGGALAGLS